MQGKIVTGLGCGMRTSFEAIIQSSTKETWGVGRGYSKVSPEHEVKRTQNKIWVRLSTYLRSKAGGECSDYTQLCSFSGKGRDLRKGSQPEVIFPREGWGQGLYWGSERLSHSDLFSRCGVVHQASLGPGGICLKPPHFPVL